jgi:signal transduction histidine kinase
MVSQPKCRRWTHVTVALQQRTAPADAETMEVSENTDGRQRLELQEVRAPLDSILAYLDLLLEEDMSMEESRRFLEVIRSSAARARNLVADREGFR